ncbi:MAG: rRNA maturation RNase YbeY [Acidobacteria bacterium]|nr:rRNA maturation RNase YbeY [Acidobacteriota bacterium]
MPPAENRVLFQHRCSAIRRGDMQAFAHQIARLITDFICVVTTDEHVQDLNRKFRNKNEATDVLSFPGSNEIAISYDRALVQAREFGHTVDQEVRILMIHGALHLAGYDHERDSGEMARAEGRWRKKFRLPEGLIARAGKAAE